MNGDPNLPGQAAKSVVLTWFDTSGSFPDYGWLKGRLLETRKVRFDQLDVLNETRHTYTWSNSGNTDYLATRWTAPASESVRSKNLAGGIRERRERHVYDAYGLEWLTNHDGDVADTSADRCDAMPRNANVALWIVDKPLVTERWGRTANTGLEACFTGGATDGTKQARTEFFYDADTAMVGSAPTVGHVVRSRP